MKLKKDSTLNREYKAFWLLFYIGIVLLLFAGVFEFVFSKDSFDNHIGFIINVMLGLSASSLISSATIYFPFAKIKEDEKLNFNSNVRKIYVKYKWVCKDLEMCDPKRVKLHIKELNEQIKIFVVQYNKMNFNCVEFEKDFKTITGLISNAINDIEYYIEKVNVIFNDKIRESYTEEEISEVFKELFNVIVDSIDTYEIQPLCTDAEVLDGFTEILVEDYVNMSVDYMDSKKSKKRMANDAKLINVYTKITEEISNRRFSKMVDEEIN